MALFEFRSPINLNNNEAKGFVVENLPSDPSTKGGRLYFNSTEGRLRFFNGTEWVNVGDSASVEGIVSVLAASNSPITVSTSSNTATLDINEATPSNKGAMSAADKAKLDAATNANTANAIVRRDGSGNFAAGTITADLTGTASNATNLDNQTPAYYLNRANHTGTQNANTISNLATTVKAYRLDEFAVPTSDVSMNSHKITNVATPTNPTDAANKAYVDSRAAGLDPKDSVRVATTANITLSGTQTIDGVALQVGDRVLVKDQTTASDNGIYVVASGAWTRSPDADTSEKVTAGMFTFIEEGDTHAGSGWVLTTTGDIVVGVTALSFTRFSSQGEILAGNGLSKSGNTLSVTGTANRITVGANGVDIASNYAGQTSITTLGNITTGTWNGSTIAASRGGTGISSYTTGNFLRAASSSTLEQRTPAQVRADIGAVEANSAITAGTATKITYDSKGLVTGGASLVEADLPNLSAGKVTSGTFDIARIPTITVAKGGTGLTSVTADSYLKGNGTGALVPRTYAQVKTDLGLNNVENTAISTWAGSSNITTVGTITSGTWNGSAISVARGGTGATTAAAARANLGAVTKYVTTIGNNSASEFTVTHNLNTRDVEVAVYETASPYSKIYCGIEHETVNSVTLSFGDIPSNNEYTVVVIG